MLFLFLQDGPSKQTICNLKSRFICFGFYLEQESWKRLCNLNRNLWDFQRAKWRPLKENWYNPVYENNILVIAALLLQKNPQGHGVGIIFRLVCALMK